jgi:hypothetical protein
MLHILAQYDVEVAWSGDQEVVEAFPAQGADEAFRDRIRAGCPDRVGCQNLAMASDQRFQAAASY